MIPIVLIALSLLLLSACQLPPTPPVVARAKSQAVIPTPQPTIQPQESAIPRPKPMVTTFKTQEPYGLPRPANIAIDKKDNLYVACWQRNSVVYKVSQQGAITYLPGAGVTTAGYADVGDGTLNMSVPEDVAVAQDNTVYVAEPDYNVIAKVNEPLRNPNYGSRFVSGDNLIFVDLNLTATLTWIAGQYTTSTGGFEDGIGKQAKFNAPRGIAVDPQGNLYIADTGNHSIRKVTPAGEVTTLAGNGTKGFADGKGAVARFNWPIGIAIDDNGQLYVSDNENQRICKITPDGQVTTLAGETPRTTNTVPTEKTGLIDGSTKKTLFGYPNGLTVDRQGNVYVVVGRSNKIMMIDPSGNVSTVAGTGERGEQDGPAEQATFEGPEDVVINAQNDTLYVTDGTNRIRKITGWAK